MRRLGTGRSLAFLLLVALAPIQFLNFTGFCYGEHRWYSDRELLDIAIGDQMKRQPRDDRERNRVYQSIEEFRAENPDCCELQRSGNNMMDLNPTFVRIIGWYWAVAHVWYRANNTPNIENFYAADTAINACGKMAERWGIPEARGPSELGAPAAAAQNALGTK